MKMQLKNDGKMCECGFAFTEWKSGNLSALPLTVIPGFYRHCSNIKPRTLWDFLRRIPRVKHTPAESWPANVAEVRT